MSQERRSENPIYSHIPEMPSRKHTPELVNLLMADMDPAVSRARNTLFDTLKNQRGLDRRDIYYLEKMAAVANWLHRNERRKLNDEPYIVHPLEAAILVAEHVSIPKHMVRRAVAGILLHDTVENNPHVSLLKLRWLVGSEVTNDVKMYSRKNAKDKQQGKDTEISPETYLANFLTAEPHLRSGKVLERINNMRNMPPGATKMYDKYFKKETDSILNIIGSLPEKGRKLYEDYREAHNKNKRPSDPSLPPFE